MLKKRSVRVKIKVYKTSRKFRTPKRALTGNVIISPTGMTKVIKDLNGSL